MVKIKTIKQSHPLSFYACQRLKKNKPALFGLFLICLFVLVAIFGYLISPDSTPDANEQKLELSIKHPGFIMKELRIRKNEPSHYLGFFSRIIFGQESDYKTVPFYDFVFTENDIIYEEYNGSEHHSGLKIKYNIADVIYAIDYSKPFNDNVTEGIVEFYDIDSGRQLKLKTNEMKTDIIGKNIRKHKYILGTDRVGRDMLSRLIIGTRVSLAVGFIAVILSIFIGMVMGTVSGYYSGVIDNVIMWIINVLVDSNFVIGNCHNFCFG